MKNIARGLRLYESSVEAMDSLIDAYLTPHQDALVKRAFRNGLYLGKDLREDSEIVDPTADSTAEYGEIDKGDEEENTRGLDDKTGSGLDQAKKEMPKPVKPGEIDEAIAHGRIGNVGYIPAGSKQPIQQPEPEQECQECPICQCAPCHCERCAVCGQEDCVCAELDFTIQH